MFFFSDVLHVWSLFFFWRWYINDVPLFKQNHNWFNNPSGEVSNGAKIVHPLFWRYPIGEEGQVFYLPCPSFTWNLQMMFSNKEPPVPGCHFIVIWKAFLKSASQDFLLKANLQTTGLVGWLVVLDHFPRCDWKKEKYLKPAPGGNIVDTSFKHQIWRSFWHQGASRSVQSKPWQFPKQIDARCSRVSIMYVFRTLLDISALVVHVPKTAVYFRVNVGNQTKVS